MYILSFQGYNKIGDFKGGGYIIVIIWNISILRGQFNGQ